MVEVVLELGPVAFSAFEIPSGINFGGRQLVAVHQLTDGRRVVDTIGATESEVSFAGAFSGPTATFRARVLNSLRTTGAELRLSWDAFCYTVVVSRFDAAYENPSWIPYRLSCTVLQDDAAPAPALAPSLGVSVLADLSVAAGLSSDLGVDLSGAQNAVMVSGASTLGTAAYAAANVAISAAQSDVESQIALAETGVTSTPLSGATSPASLANGLYTVSDAAQWLAGLTCSNSYVRRAARNLQSASS
jgi:hypothetical protein